jgi:glycosyltransferase involved in cell wall biosynthesis
MKPVKILHVCTISLTAKVFIAPLAKYLSERGYMVTIACSDEKPAQGQSAVEELRNAGFRMQVIPMRRDIRLIDDFISIFRLYRFIRRERFDIVHTQTSKAGFIGRTAAKLAGTPIIIHTAHAFPFHPYLKPATRKFYIALEKLAGTFTDLIMVDTEAVRKDGIQYMIKEPSKILTVNMGINLDRFSPHRVNAASLREEFGFDSKTPVVGTVARLVPDKGLKCFLRSAAQVARVIPDTRFLIVGEGPLRQALECLAEELGIRDKVIFTGFRNDIPELLAIMDVFVLPTLREGFGVVLAEAMAMAKPVISSDIGPVAEVVVDGETGFLVPPDEAALFAQKTLLLLRDEHRQQQMGISGRKRVEKLFDEKLMFRKIEAEYRRLLEEKGISAESLRRTASY